jgi:hypothetical protein
MLLNWNTKVAGRYNVPRLFRPFFIKLRGVIQAFIGITEQTLEQPSKHWSSRANIGISRANIGSSRANIGISRANIGSSRANIGISQANIGISRANIGSNQPSLELVK